MKAATQSSFEDIFMKCENRIHAIFTFLAMLELVQLNYLGINIGTGRNNFILEWNASADTPISTTSSEL
jgi:segregation and condensation protein A